MQKKPFTNPILFASFLIAISVVLSSCGPGQMLGPTITPTPTYTPTPTNTPTPTDTPAPTNTPTPTNTPKPTSTPTPNYSEVGLVLDDLPDGFESIPPETMDLSKDELSDEFITVFNIFSYGKVEPYTLISGFQGTLLSKFFFDAGLNQPEKFMQEIMGSTEGSEESISFTKPEIIELETIGDNSFGFSSVVESMGMPMRVDILVFRRDMIATTIYLMYYDGEQPEISMAEIGKLLDDRILGITAE